MTEIGKIITLIKVFFEDVGILQDVITNFGEFAVRILKICRSFLNDSNSSESQKTGKMMHL